MSRAPGDDTDGICDNCGSAKAPGLAVCKYCGRPFVADLVNRAVPCWSCKTYSDWGVMKCSACGVDVVRACLFCHAISPHHVPSCLRCREPFAGMAERAAEKARQAQVQSVAKVGMGLLGVLGKVASEAGHHHGGRRRRHRH